MLHIEDINEIGAELKELEDIDAQIGSRIRVWRYAEASIDRRMGVAQTQSSQRVRCSSQHHDYLIRGTTCSVIQ